MLLQASVPQDLQQNLSHFFLLHHMDDTLKDNRIECCPQELLLQSMQQLIATTLQKQNGNRTKTAAALGINKTTLWRKMKKYNL